jgi:hypothetical protein
MANRKNAQPARLLSLCPHLHRSANHAQVQLLYGHLLGTYR